MIQTLKKQMMATLILAGLTTAHTSFAQEKSHEALREAFRACHDELGIEQPEPGQRPQAPDEETRKKIDTCLKEKGFEVSKFGRGGGPGKGRPERSSDGGVQ
ncbi:hypothetical protein AB1A81_06400 [Bdellovibrio bacteriovorus]|uniref:Secreted protein n=1 Tax=Bdellovibrio bacteriovorus (strain ATCC 15356 / DSM 50701 / NCIMB 9529 / HD100) TaxID=264462 RepID=Q6MN56_BDEBA|nr:hypothetical protein [Bdellovibrio bacteriovorus]CAE79296.1 hypothetical protein predicted by Glimmer/Critica [Bdellovibrio bacteriovorus HD100]